MKNKSGFTLIELTVVLAILAILAAILIPTFLLTTDRARLRGDIQTARTIQNAIDLYTVERGDMPAGTGAAIDARIARLISEGYLPNRDVAPQTQGAQWVWDQTNGVRINIGGSPDSARRALENLTLEERQYFTP